MATYILVGGAWIGAWAWKRVSNDLRSRGHEVYPLSLTGLGERVHLARPEIDLDTHIDDVINLVRYEDLENVTLVGHSYAGIVITGVADRIGDRLGRLVFVDSAPLENGEAMLGFSPPEVQEQIRRQVKEDGDGWLLPPIPFAGSAENPSLAGLSADDLQLLAAKAVPQPFKTYTQPLKLSGQPRGNYEKVIIACNDFRKLVASGIPRFQQFAPPMWRIEHLQTGHWPMLSQAKELAEALSR